MAKKDFTVKPKSVLIDSSGKPQGVFLDIQDYEKLLDMVEDVADLSWMESMRSEEKNAVPWEDVKRRLKEDGLI